MNFSETFIRRPVATILLTILLVVVGAVSYFKLPVNSLPTVDFPVIQIQVFYPGASPATMASTVATPLENQCMQINGLKAILSDNREGQSTLTLTFELDRNVDLMAPDVQAAISRALADLPKDLPQPPSYTKANPSDKPIMYLALTTETMTPGDLYYYANQLVAKKLAMVTGVSQVQIFGAKRAIRIKMDPDRLAAYSLGLNEVAQALTRGTVSIPGGSLDGPSRTFSLEPQGQLLTAEDYAGLIVGMRGGAPIHLRDVASCEDSVNNDSVDIRFAVQGGKIYTKSIVMPVSRATGANTVAVAKRVEETLAEIRKELPAAIGVHTIFSAAEPIGESIDDVQITILIAIALVVLIIFLFLGRIRETVIPSITLPIALIGTCGIMLASKFSLDTLSLMALVLSVGFLVDDAIVVLENTVRHLDDGMPPMDAAVRSMKEISATIFSISLVLVTVFVPLVFMSGVVGRNFKEFALTVIYAVAVSMVLALTLAPMMCSRILRHSEKKNAVQTAIDRSIRGLIAGYGVCLHWTLRHKWISLLIWLLCIAGTGVAFTFLPKNFLPPGDSSFIMGAMITPQGTSSAQMSKFQTAVSETILRNTNVLSVGTVSGFLPGADQSLGFVFIHLLNPTKRVRDANGKRPKIEDVAAELSAALFAIPEPIGVVFASPNPVLQLSSGGEATAQGSKYSYTLRGTDRALVYETAQKLEQRMKGVKLTKFGLTLPAFIAVQNSVKLTMPRLNINILRDRASALGITALDIEYALALAFAEGRLTTFHTDNEQYDVMTVLADSHRKTPADLEKINLRSSVTGGLVPLKSVVRWVEDAGPQSVPHFQQLEAATLSFNIIEQLFTLGETTAALEKIAKDIMPAGVVGEFGGQAKEFQSSMSSLGILLIAAIFLMYIILGVLYESFIHPFTVLTTLPVAAFGGFATLLLFRSELSLYAYIGVFMLLGIIAKNGIMMVDFAEQGRHEGKNSFDAIYHACLVRFRPILMTGLAAIFGALPIALGFGADAESRIPLGLVVVGGLVFAQVVTLFVTPGIFLYMDELQNWLTRGKSKE